MNPKRITLKEAFWSFQWWNLNTQGIYNVSQPKRISLQRHSTLKLPPLYFQVSLSSSSTQKTEPRSLNSALQLTQSCHDYPNHVTIPCVRPKVHKSYPQIMSRFYSRKNHAPCLRNRATNAKSCPSQF